VDISFRYPNTEKLVVDNVNLAIKVGSKVAFVGSTGEGKSTLIDIILGLLEPNSGQILIDGHPLGSADVRQWQRSIGYVPQQIYLSDHSIYSNIAFGECETSIDFDAVEKAAAIAGLYDFVSKELPLGFDTKVGEHGVRLSGGQRQRIGIARAIYRQPQVLVLDEATSALDSLTEQTVMSNIFATAQVQTVIIIAHRLATVKGCDMIYLVEGGKIKSEGTYEHLARFDEKFRGLSGV
jgi:ABC-type bacteriocin/lantibiotic exporter with double-glycine peptidase domain